MHQPVEHAKSGAANAAALLASARQGIALTGAGISVPSGIPDFRSAGGLWSRFRPEEYATLEGFLQNPAKSWQLFRAMAKTLADKRPNPAHYALATLEQKGCLRAVITQNVDGLHQAAGSSRVVEMHGGNRVLHCLRCGHEQDLNGMGKAAFEEGGLPLCPACAFALKPKIVLFGEEVAGLEAVYRLAAGCDVFLVIGTSARVYPAAALPGMVARHGGGIIEMNREPSLAAATGIQPDFFLGGDIVQSLPRLLQELAQLV